MLVGTALLWWKGGGLSQGRSEASSWPWLPAPLPSLHACSLHFWLWPRGLTACCLIQHLRVWVWVRTMQLSLPLLVLSFTSLHNITTLSRTFSWALLLVAQSYQTLCHPMACRTPGLPVHHQLLELAQTRVHWVGDAIQPSHPLSSPSPPAFSLSQHQGLFQWVDSASGGQSIGASASEQCSGLCELNSVPHGHVYQELRNGILLGNSLCRCN